MSDSIASTLSSNQLSSSQFYAQLKVQALDKSASQHIQQIIDNKLKPLGSLGKLEPLALQLQLICKELTIEQPELFLFAADHGIAEQGVSIGPKEVTALLMEQAAAGRCAINSLCNVNQIKLHLINAGLASPCELNGVIQQPIALGTQDFSQQAAMTQAQAQQAITLGQGLAQAQIRQGCDCVLLGEMGIGNTTTAAALFSALSNYAPADCVGAGAGVDEATIAKKAALIEQAFERFSAQADVLTLLAEVGGFELAQMAGAIIGAAQLSVPVVIDGFICTAAALVAVNLAPECRDYLIFAHSSNEQGHQKMLELLEAEPLLNLGLRLGEGTGAAMAMPVIRSAQAFFKEMGTLADVGLV